MTCRCSRFKGDGLNSLSSVIAVSKVAIVFPRQWPRPRLRLRRTLSEIVEGGSR